MRYESDKFRVNWTEKVRDNNSGNVTVVTCITGYTYQIEDWKKSYFSQFAKDAFDTKVLTKINNNHDKTETVTISRLEKPKEIRK